MKKISFVFLVAFCQLLAVHVSAQNELTYKVIDSKTPLTATIDFSQQIPSYEPKLTLIQAVVPSSPTDMQIKKAMLDDERKKYLNNKIGNVGLGKKGSAPSPILLRDFFGNVSQGTPNDNDIAVSNS